MSVVNSETAASRLAAEENWSDFHGHKWLWAEFWRRNSKGICGPEGKYKAKPPRGRCTDICAAECSPDRELGNFSSPKINRRPKYIFQRTKAWCKTEKQQRGGTQAKWPCTPPLLLPWPQMALCEFLACKLETNSTKYRAMFPAEKSLRTELKDCS